MTEEQLNEPICSICGNPRSHWAHRERYLGHNFKQAVLLADDTFNGEKA